MQVEVSVLYWIFEAFEAVTIKNAVFWDGMKCGFCKNQCLEERIASIIRVLQLLVSANVVSSSLMLFALMMEAICSFEPREVTFFMLELYSLWWGWNIHVPAR
jgi:hypothetical protein